MSDGILNGIFLIVHRNFLLSHFRGCWLLNFFFACVCSKYVDMKRLSRRFQADVFIKRLLQRGHEFWDETNLLAKEMLYNSARFLLVFIFIHDNDKKRPFTRPACSQRTQIATDQYELDSMVVMFMNCLCLSIFWKNSRVYFPTVMVFTFGLKFCRSFLK